MVKGVQAVDEDGNHLWTFDAKSAIRALELLGKHMAMFTDKNKEQEQIPEDVKISIAVRKAVLSIEDEKQNHVQE